MVEVNAEPPVNAGDPSPSAAGAGAPPWSGHPPPPPNFIINLFIKILLLNS
jgi:hypothetical protein